MREALAVGWEKGAWGIALQPLIEGDPERLLEWTNKQVIGARTTLEVDEVAKRLERLPLNAEAIRAFVEEVGDLTPQRGKRRSEVSARLEACKKAALLRKAKRRLPRELKNLPPLARTSGEGTAAYGLEMSPCELLSEIFVELRNLYLIRNLLAQLRSGKRPNPIDRPDNVPPDAFYYVPISPRLDPALSSLRHATSFWSGGEQGLVTVQSEKSPKPTTTRYFYVQVHNSPEHIWMTVLTDPRISEAEMTARAKRSKQSAPSLLAMTLTRTVRMDAPVAQWIETAWAVLAPPIQAGLNAHTELQWNPVDGDITIRSSQMIATSAFGAAWDALMRSIERGSTAKCDRCGKGFTPDSRFRRGGALYCSIKCRRAIRRQRTRAVGLRDEGRTPAQIAKEMALTKRRVDKLLKDADTPQSQKARARAKHMIAKRKLAVELYGEGRATDQIAEELGLDEEFVNYMLKSAKSPRG